MIDLTALTLEELTTIARALTAAGYPVVLDDGPIWIGALGRDAWHSQLRQRCEHAWGARRAVERCATRRAAS